MTDFTNDLETSEQSDALVATIEMHADAILNAIGSKQKVLEAVLACHQDGYMEGVYSVCRTTGEA